MAFKSYKPFKKSTYSLKIFFAFMFGMLSVMVFSNAFNIVTGIENATQYIKQIILTENGLASGTTGVFLDGALHRVGADYLCNRVASGTSSDQCAQIQSIVSLVNNPPSGGGGILVETDPTVGSHIKSITAANISNRNTAFGRGNHASAGYLTSESDPQVGSTTSGQRCIGNGTQVTCNQSAPSAGGDDLGNHTATTNIRLGSNYLSYGATNAGLQVMSDGDVYISNNLGISTNNPSQKLHVNGNAYISGGWLKVKGGEPQVHLQPTSTTSTLFLEGNPSSYIKFGGASGSWSDNFYIGNDTSNSLVFGRLNGTSNYKTVMTIKTGGNLGIGTSYPSYPFDVQSTGRFTKKLIANGGLDIGANSTLDGDFYISDGSVGIGTQPSSVDKLSVLGSIKISTTQAACNSSNAGSIKYDGCFRGCNGISWTTLGECPGGSCGTYHNQNYDTIPGNGNCSSGLVIGFQTHNISTGYKNRTRQCTNNGTTVDCYANKKIDGVCSATSCTYGRFVDIGYGGDVYYRRCEGYNGGLSVDCDDS